MKLTKHNYHTPENTLISNSKVKLYMQSKEMYKKRYIDHEPQEINRPLKIGKMVDWAFETGDVASIYDEFPVKTKKTVLKKDCKGNPHLLAIYEQEALMIEQEKRMDQSIFVTEDEQMTALAMSKKILGSELYKWYKKPGMRRYFQKVVHDDRACGMLDVLVVDDKNKICYIDDLKTSTPADMTSDKAWFWKCYKFSYFTQMAIYKHFVQEKYPDYKVICRHMVIGSAEPHEIKLYTFEDKEIQSILKDDYEAFMSWVEEIEKETEFVDEIPIWDDAYELKKPGNGIM